MMVLIYLASLTGFICFLFSSFSIVLKGSVAVILIAFLLIDHYIIHGRRDGQDRKEECSQVTAKKRRRKRKNKSTNSLLPTATSLKIQPSKTLPTNEVLPLSISIREQMEFKSKQKKPGVPPLKGKVSMVKVNPTKVLPPLVEIEPIQISVPDSQEKNSIELPILVSSNPQIEEAEAPDDINHFLASLRARIATSSGFDQASQRVSRLEQSVCSLPVVK